MTTAKKKFLTKDREIELGYIIKDYYTEKDKGDDADPRLIKLGEEAINELISNNTLLVKKLAASFKKKYPYAPDMEDLVQWGMIGIMKAVEKYDPERGNKFSTMAYNWINVSITRNSNINGRFIRIPENKLFLISKISARETELSEAGLSKHEAQEVLSEEFRMSARDINKLQTLSREALSLNAKIRSEDSDSAELINFVSDDYTESSAEESAMAEVLKADILECVSSLPEVQQWVVSAASGYVLPSQAVAPKPAEVKMKFGLDKRTYSSQLRAAYASVREGLKNKGYSSEDFFPQD